MIHRASSPDDESIALPAARKAPKRDQADSRRRRRRRRRRCVTRARPVHARAAAHASSSPLLRGARIFGEGEG